MNSEIADEACLSLLPVYTPLEKWAAEYFALTCDSTVERTSRAAINHATNLNPLLHLSPSYRGVDSLGICLLLPQRTE